MPPRQRSRVQVTVLPGPGVIRVEALDRRRRRDERAVDAPQGQPDAGVARDRDAVRRDRVVDEHVSAVDCVARRQCETSPSARRSVTAVSASPPGVGAADGVDRPDRAIEELVLVHDEAVGHARSRAPTRARRATASSIQSRSPTLDSLEERTCRGCLEASASPNRHVRSPDRLEDEREDDAGRSRAVRASAPRHEQEERGRERRPPTSDRPRRSSRRSACP